MEAGAIQARDPEARARDEEVSWRSSGTVVSASVCESGAVEEVGCAIKPPKGAAWISSARKGGENERGALRTCASRLEPPKGAAYLPVCRPLRGLWPAGAGASPRLRAGLISVGPTGPQQHQAQAGVPLPQRVSSDYCYPCKSVSICGPKPFSAALRLCVKLLFARHRARAKVPAPPRVGCDRCYPCKSVSICGPKPFFAALLFNNTVRWRLRLLFAPMTEM